VVPAEFSCRALCVQALHDMMWLFSQLLVSRMIPCRREAVLVYRRSYSFVSRLQGVGHGRPRGLFKLLSLVLHDGKDAVAFLRFLQASHALCAMHAAWACYKLRKTRC
jgi:hypothetical protein